MYYSDTKSIKVQWSDNNCNKVKPRVFLVLRSVSQWLKVSYIDTMVSVKIYGVEIPYKV